MPDWEAFSLFMHVIAMFAWAGFSIAALVSYNKRGICLETVAWLAAAAWIT